MGLLLELLEHVIGYISSWRLFVAWTATAIALWLLLEFGPQGHVGTVLALAVATGGIVGGWRWARGAES